MKKPALFIILSIASIATILFFVIKAKKNSPTPIIEEPVISLPVNTIPVAERPFSILTPNSTGRSLNMLIAAGPATDVIEYELVYQVAGKQEGVFGRLNPGSEQYPIEKDLLLGSKSAGGKVTYHEGVTGGSLTYTYGELKLKEQFNFLHFDTTDSLVSSPDARFSLEFTPTALKDDQVIIIMKTFGLPMELDDNLVAGPYGYSTAATPKGEVAVSIKLPAGEHLDPTIQEYDSVLGEFTPLVTTLDGDTVSATIVDGNIFVVTTE